MRKRRRCKKKIDEEILSICSKGENVTRIINRSNTNFTTARRVIQSLMTNNLLEMIEGSPVLYKTTPKGMIIRDRLKVFQKEMEGHI